MSRRREEGDPKSLTEGMSPAELADLDAPLSFVWDAQELPADGTDAVAHFKAEHAGLDLLITSRLDQLVDMNYRRLRAITPLATELPAKGDQRGQWQKQKARELGIQPRRLRDLLAMYAAVKSGLADGLPIRALRRPPREGARCHPELDGAWGLRPGPAEEEEDHL